MPRTEVLLKEGMKISEQELLAQGCRLVSNFALDSEVFEKGNQFIYRSAETQTIWRILPKSK